MFTQIKDRDLNTPLLERIAKFQAKQQESQHEPAKNTATENTDGLETSDTSRLNPKVKRKRSVKKTRVNNLSDVKRSKSTIKDNEGRASVEKPT